LLLFVIVVRACVRHLPTEQPQKPNLPTEPIICRRSCRRSQLFADRAKYLPTELPISQICQKSQIIADGAAGAKYLPTELPQKPNWPMEPNISQRTQIFPNGAKYLTAELPRSQICGRSEMIADRAARAKYLPTELPQKPNCRRIQLFAGGATAKTKFADGATYLPTELQEPNIC
jgi:hypothetical protein